MMLSAFTASNSASASERKETITENSRVKPSESR
ncbi:Uncharacterised protein [Vibrio cholerae]|nr:Uncharacterised protein [Vibrio cholerae]